MACIATAGPALGATISYDGTYSGERSPTIAGTPSCAGQESVTVIVTGSALKFTNSEWRDIPFKFNPEPDGSFSGVLDDPAGHVVGIRGKATGTAIDVDVFNYGKGCEHQWHLEKAPR
jgi:hypothetical protein